MSRLSDRDVDALTQMNYENALADGEEWAEEAYRVRANEKPPEATCPRCHGSGLIWLGTSSKRRARVNEDWEPCMAAFQCPVCPDDGSGNWIGTGRVNA